MANPERPNRWANPQGQTVWAKKGATTAFKAINPELFIKPNKFTTVVGVIALSGCVAFMAYLHAIDENKKDREKIQKTFDDDGKYVGVHEKKSRWD